MTRVMITNGNNFHPADYHAEVTAEKIVVVGETASAEIVQASRAFRKTVEAILCRHHADVEKVEQAALAEHGSKRYDDAYISKVDESIMQDIVAASRGTALEAHFARSDVQAAILGEIEHETRSQSKIHREVHATAAILAAGPRLVS